MLLTTTPKFIMNPKLFSSLLAIGVTLGCASVNAATIFTETFESGASGWNLNASPGTSTTDIVSVDLGLGDGASNVLRIATGSFYQIAESPTINLTDATFATITFDYGDTNGGGTRFISVDLWDGSTWRDLSGSISHNTANGELTYNVTTVAWFGSGNKFRFEGKNAGGGGTQYTYIDNVVITSDAIPEPTSALLGSLGLLALLRRRR
jgi:hypothetical protein